MKKIILLSLVKIKTGTVLAVILFAVAVLGHFFTIVSLHLIVKQ